MPRTYKPRPKQTRPADYEAAERERDAALKNLHLERWGSREARKSANEHLLADNQRLREALERVLKYEHGDIDCMTENAIYLCRAHMHRCFDIARAALRGEGAETDNTSMR